MKYPQIIQGGMGVGVSNWKLARSVSTLGHLGVVSGTALGTLLARRLQLGEEEGLMRRAFDSFPFPKIARRVWDQYFVKGGKPAGKPFKAVPFYSAQSSQALDELTVLGNFTEVFLAKEGHDNEVGINYLEKIQFPTLTSIYGAMLAGVGFVLMGAGIPRSIPGIMDDLALGNPVRMKFEVSNATQGAEYAIGFDPAAFSGGIAPKLKRPKFLAIVSSATLAIALARKSTGRVDGFIVEAATAGGHNAPPRGPLQLNDKGEPIYGERDTIELDKIKQLGLPFWLAGSFGLPGKLAEALDSGAAGIQVGTAFAFCEESGIAPELKRRVIEQYRNGDLKIFTDPNASPTGFPFKVIQVEGTLSDPKVYNERKRICDLGVLRQTFQKPDGTLGYRCGAEPVDVYESKGGIAENAFKRQCLCNALFADIGLGQVSADGITEKPLLTAGDEIASLSIFLPPDRDSYTAADVIEKLLA